MREYYFNDIADAVDEKTEQHKTRREGGAKKGIDDKVSASVESVAEAVAERIRRERGPLAVRQCPVYSRRVGGKEVAQYTETGFIVAIEGIDGAGVTTAAKALVAAFNTLLGGARAVYTKEPTDGPIGSLIRLILRGFLRGPEEPEVLAHLFMADRIYHVYEYPILPGVRGVAGAIAAGMIVVVDRYKYSNAVYQSYDPALARRAVYTMEDILRLNELAPPAHILIYIDADPAEAYMRIVSGRQVVERIETVHRLVRIREGFRRLVEMLRRNPEWPGEQLGAEPPWRAKLAASINVDINCLYPPALIRAPILVEIENKGKSLKEFVEEVVEKATITLIETGYLVEQG